MLEFPTTNHRDGHTIENALVGDDHAFGSDEHINSIRRFGLAEQSRSQPTDQERGHLHTYEQCQQVLESFTRRKVSVLSRPTGKAPTSRGMSLPVYSDIRG
jgi:hypothetical protein